MCVVACLSQNMVKGLLNFTCNSRNRFLIHFNSHAVSAISLYSAFALDLATTTCFLLLHVTRFPATNT